MLLSISSLNRVLLGLVLLFLFPAVHANQQTPYIEPAVQQQINHFGQSRVIVSIKVPIIASLYGQSRDSRLRALKGGQLSLQERLDLVAEGVAEIQEEVLNALPANSYDLKYQYSHIPGLALMIDQVAFDILKTHDKVSYIETDKEGTISLAEASPVVGANHVHSNLNYTGNGVTVAVLDTGIDTDHSDFTTDSAITGQKCYSSYSPPTCPPSGDLAESDDAEDGFGHGSHVSGIITRANGIAPDAKIVSVKVINDSATYLNSDLIAGLDWVYSNLVTNSVKVINLSLGDQAFTTVANCEAGDGGFSWESGYLSSFTQLTGEDVAIFAASGNGGNKDANFGGIDRPSCLSPVISVGATTTETPEAVTGFTNSHALLDILAPGKDILSTQMGGGTVEDSGTSMSTPVAVGVAALLLEADGSLTPAEIKTALIATGKMITDSGNGLSFPRIDALAAIDYVKNQPPTASVNSANNVNNSHDGNTSYSFEIQYDDDVAINKDTLDDNDVKVVKDATEINAVFDNVTPNEDAATLTATYSITPPDGSWDATDNGTYTITINADEVEGVATKYQTVAGHTVASGDLGTFTVNIDTALPYVNTVTANEVGSGEAGSNTYNFTVEYQDDNAIDVATLDNSDIRVTNTDGFNVLAVFNSVDNNTDGTPRAATYQITPPDGNWDEADNGTYQIALETDQVKDNAGNFAAAGNLATFTVSIDTTDPQATLITADNVTTGSGTTYTFEVQYTDNNSLNVGSFDNQDIRITSGGGYDALAQFNSVDDNTDGTPRTVTYQITPPGGFWDQNDNDTYQMTVEANQVADVDGNTAIAGNLGSFTVDIDETKPTVTTTNATDIDVAGGTAYTFTVTYTDNQAIDVNSLDNQDIRVSNGSGYDVLAQFNSVDNNTNGTPRTATYQITPPGGNWNDADNGTYQLTIQANQVQDTSGNAILTANLASFTVNIDSTLPHVTAFNADDVTDAGATSYTFAITYADDNAIDVSTLDNNDIEVTNSGAFSQMAQRISIDNNTDGTPRTVTYQLTPPGGDWDEADNDTYQVDLQANQVDDNAGNSADAVTLGTFTVNIDSTKPTANLTSSTDDITTAGKTVYEIKVQYDDNQAIDVSTLDDQDIRVTADTISFDVLAELIEVNPDGNGQPRTATYHITPPGGYWNDDDNDTYEIQLEAGQVKDTAGNAVDAEEIGSLTVNIADTSHPPIKQVDGIRPITQPENTPYHFTVRYLYTEDGVGSVSTTEGIDVDSLGDDDIVVTGPNNLQMSAKKVSVTTDGQDPPDPPQEVTVTYEFTPPGGWSADRNGTYRINLQDGQVKDTKGNFAVAGTLSSFSVNITTTSPEKSQPFYPPPPEPDFYLLSVGSPNGHVISEPEGIDCNRGQGKCSHLFPRIDEETNRFTRVKLTTIAPDGLYFDHWGGDMDCEDGEIWMTDMKSCMAYFYGIPKTQSSTTSPTTATQTPSTNTQTSATQTSPTTTQTPGTQLSMAGYLNNITASGLLQDNTTPLMVSFSLTEEQMIFFKGVANGGLDPKITLSQTETGHLIAENDDWVKTDNLLSLAEYIMPAVKQTAGLLVTLPAGNYTADLTLKQGATQGELTLLLTAPNTAHTLTHLSARAGVAENQWLSLQFTLEASPDLQPSTLLLKTWSVDGKINPALNLKETTTGNIIGENDDWQTDGRSGEIPNGLQPLQSQDAALLREVTPGSYQLNLPTEQSGVGGLSIEIVN